jgi:hypothetical protein
MMHRHIAQHSIGSAIKNRLIFLVTVLRWNEKV